ncbi:Eco57I restriction-modification methylase domain-containing protein [Thiospirillum jenense]|uniref:site-specific DNA-methyltransferase (adenine-specific) n=1 Tax=Thiospirillum jenense TaxID=1653858 RepID=A0A839H9T0_9GAMM|nr:TaqI-like C-terminal specificity domain-containing protein [Thiospirillum jenense]MBB1125574.1 Eco57I restriction-modification methylase domain-containing protein [Thiospirillum jenense]
MNPQQARIYIANLFSCAFNRGKFLEFTRNLLNDNFDENKAAVWPKKYIKDAFKPFVNHYERLGTYTAPDDEKLDVLIVHLTNDAQLERARTATRNFIADHLQQRDDKDAALVAIVAPDATQWRFSYVKMEYSAIETAAGTVGIKTQLTPARRSSYLVGANESCHTAQSRFIGLLQEVRRSPTLTEIEEAFSVESVTKEFFKQYVQLFNQCEAALTELVANDAALAAEFTRAQINPVEFIKKLLGQLVFLYFLQKKGWLGVAKDGNWGSGARDFLRQLTNGAHGQYTNLFNDVLEPLLYDTLATDRGHAAWCAQFNCRLPFLNGGLFEPLGNYHWREVDVLLPNELFTNSERNAAGDVGTGIFDVFDRYNFTVNEAEPLEKDVAIDPEMLGKVFENLIEDNRRKGLGAYYTPREIVHYMCQESLINYLETQLNTPELTAVPRADLETLVRAGEQLVNYESVKTQYAGREMPAAIQHHAKLIDEALAAMTVCDSAVGSGAFPVGMMMEIVRARSALTPYFNTALPRSAYLFKRHAIQHCLYGVDIDPGAVEIAKLRLWLSLVVDEEEVEQIKPLPNLDYKIVVGNSLLGVSKDLFNEALFRQLETLKPRYFNESDRDKKAQYRQEIEAIIQQLINGKAAFDFEIYFSEVFHYKKGFDVVIGNPPYGAKFSPELRSWLLKNYKHQSNPPESYMLFVEKGYELLRQQGVIIYIVPNTWLPSLTFQKFRRFLISHFQWLGLLIIQIKVFVAVVDTIVFAFKKSIPQEGTEFPVFFFEPVGIRFAHNLSWANIPKDGNAINVVFPPAHQKLFQKIKSNSLVLKSVADVYNGVKPFEKGKGKPPQTAETMRDKPFVVNGKKPNGVHWMPLLRGRLIQRYVTLWNNDYWIKYGEWLAAPRDTAIFDAPIKIFVRQTGDSIIATLGKSGCIARDNLHVVLPRNSTNLQFILGILNSKVTDFMYSFINPEKGEALAQVKKNHVEELPLPKFAFDNAQKINPVIELVDQILAAKSENPKEDTSALEREIDQLVYALYELMPDEIATVEGAGES